MSHLLFAGQNDRLRLLTAVVETVELGEVTGAEPHPLTDHIHEVGDLGDDGGIGVDAEGRLAVVHYRAVVIGNAQSAGHCVVVFSEVVLFT